MINDMGIQVMEEAPDADDLMLAENSNDTDDDAAQAALRSPQRSKCRFLVPTDSGN